MSSAFWNVFKIKKTLIRETSKRVFCYSVRIFVFVRTTLIGCVPKLLLSSYNETHWHLREICYDSPKKGNQIQIRIDKKSPRHKTEGLKFVQFIKRAFVIRSPFFRSVAVINIFSVKRLLLYYICIISDILTTVVRKNWIFYPITPLIWEQPEQQQV